MAKYDAFVHEGQKYDREGFKALLKQRMEAARNDKEHPFANSKHPNHAVAVQEMQLAYRWLGGEMDEVEETSVAATFNEALQAQEGNMADSEKGGLDDLHKANQLRGLPEGKIAWQRHQAGAPLTPQQAELVADILGYEKSYAERAERDKPAYGGGWTSTARPHRIPNELFLIEKIANPREKVMAIRSLKAQWRDDKASPFNDARHPEHKNAIDSMRRLYEAEQELGPQAGDEGQE